METNWVIIGIVVLICLVLVYFLIRRNLTDEKEYEEYLTENDETQYIDKSDDDDL